MSSGSFVVSRSSWHYKLYRYVENIKYGPRYVNPFADVPRSNCGVPSSLCPYAWVIFLGLIGTAVIGTALVLGAIVVLPMMFTLRVTWGFFSRLDEHMWGIKDIFKKESKVREKKERHPSLVLAFAKSHKDRVCPKIELVD